MCRRSDKATEDYGSWFLCCDVILRFTLKKKVKTVE